MADGGRAGLDDRAVQDRLLRFDELLERVEAVAGPTAEAALEAVETLVEVYGEALARVVAYADAGLVERLVADELLGHLLVLHHLHPDPPEQRIARALDEASTAARLVGIDRGVATVEVTASGCSATAAVTAVGDAVLAAAPELAGVDPVLVRPAAAPTLIPLEAVRRRPAPAGGGP